VAKDTEPASCSGDGGDVYRYELGSEAIDCVTCVLGEVNAAVAFPNSQGSTIWRSIGIAEDGSRVYFTSRHRLLPGAAKELGAYRVNVQSGELAYIGYLGANPFIGGGSSTSTISSDGSVAVFKSDASSLNALGGQQNNGTSQYYRYDDDDRSLICVSCPSDGSPPRGGVSDGVTNPLVGQLGANIGPLSQDGAYFAFATPTPLVPGDQNTAGAGQDPAAGTDVYEWRAGRLLLVSDGIENAKSPQVRGITPDGHDIFFVEAAQLTPDALDGTSRLYDARIGGGFEFPQRPKPCPLEVCQGTPKGAPEEAAPGTASIKGAGNISKTGRTVCAKPKRKVRRGGKTRCVKPARKHNRKRANHNRRTAR
jgi:hypothetical protein